MSSVNRSRAFGLATGPMVALGLGRFAYALVLAMRGRPHWSFTEAGTVNAANEWNQIHALFRFGCSRSGHGVEGDGGRHLLGSLDHLGVVHGLVADA